MNERVTTGLAGRLVGKAKELAVANFSARVQDGVPPRSGVVLP